MDVRTRFTKMAIEEAFISLLEEKPLKSITVKELCQRAQINRGTFYRYYHDPEDLLNSIEDRIIDEIAASAIVAPTEFEAHLIATLNDIKVTHEKYRALFSENGDQGFLLRFVTLGYERAAKEISSRTTALGEVKSQWLFRFLAQGCSGVLSLWVENGMEEPVEEVAQFVSGLLKGALHAASS